MLIQVKGTARGGHDADYLFTECENTEHGFYIGWHGGRCWRISWGGVRRSGGRTVNLLTDITDIDIIKE